MTEEETKKQIVIDVLQAIKAKTEDSKNFKNAGDLKLREFSDKIDLVRIGNALKDDNDNSVPIETIFHKAEHDAFRNKVIDMTLSYNKASITEGIKFAKFLYDWILSHIAHEDKLYIPKLVQYLKENSSENKKQLEQN